MSQSFAERMNSAGNDIVIENRSSLSHEMIDKLVVLRMNKRFVDRFRKRRAAATDIIRFNNKLTIE